ncbi:MAG: TIGR04255 family protein [Hydrogenophilales bacterium]|nr:TIGR04255 family protein [Hydrogenophilales bacterium]
MARVRHLKNAPVKEALIDIQFEPGVEVADINRFASSLTNEFPKQHDMWEALVGFNVDGADASANTTPLVIGKRFDTGADPHVLQCRTSGFTFSRLAPYIEWECLRKDAKRLWSVFVSMVGQQTVKRVAVRYINEINLPLPIKDFGDYLVCPPRVPESLSQGISGFLQRVVIPDEKNRCISIVNQLFEGASVMSSGQQAISVVLDIDVFRQTEIDSSKVDEIFVILDALRDQKNKMFFEHLTEPAVERFE